MNLEYIVHADVKPELGTSEAVRFALLLDVRMR